MKRDYLEINNKLNTLSPEVMYNIRKMSGKYIHIKDKEGNGRCNRCDSNIKLIAKHRSTEKCPSCGNEMEVIHDWRIKCHYPVNLEWFVVPTVIDETLVLRYVCVDDYTIGKMVTEDARMFIDEDHSQPTYYCYFEYNKKWAKGKTPYFSKPSYIYNNRLFCMYAKEYDVDGYFFNEINKLDCFKYYPVENMYDKTRIPSQLHLHVRSARMHEKLSKIGFKKLLEQNLSHYISYGDRSLLYGNKSPMEFFKLNKNTFSILKKADNIYLVDFLRKNPDVKDSDLMLVNYDKYEYSIFDKISKKIKVTFRRIVKYCKTQNIIPYELKNYIEKLEKFGYDVTDRYYSLPRSFSNALLWIEKKENTEKDILIKKISDGLRAMPDLNMYLNGSNGLMVYIPECSRDLLDEGKSMHNCIGTYIDRISANKTLILYIRQIANPTAPFVAMEYKDGRIIQLRKAYNKNVTESNVIDFANAIANTLKKNNVLVA